MKRKRWTWEERAKEKARRLERRTREREVVALNAIAATIHATDLQPRLAEGSKT